MDELIDKVQQLAELIGPNLYLQAAIIATAFILVGKVADWIISGIIGRIARKSTNDFDDSLVDLVHRPVFVSFVLLGLGLATLRVQMPEAAEFMTLGLLKTIAIFVWLGAIGGLNNLLVRTLRQTQYSKLVQSGMLSLLHNVMKVVLVAMAVYFVFLAWNIDVTAWLASAGIVGLALSFAAKDTLSNLFAGVSIIVDAPYKTGDYIILDSGERGVVTDIGLRSTRILTRDDVEITVPNGILGNSTIINEAGGPPAQHRIRIGVGVAYGSDLDHVIATLQKVMMPSWPAQSLECDSGYLVSRAWISNCWDGSRIPRIGVALSTNSIALFTKRSTRAASRFHFHSATCMYGQCPQATRIHRRRCGDAIPRE